MSLEVAKADVFKATDHTLAKNVAEKLEEKYPGWLWAVNVMDGVLSVKSMRLSGNWGFVLHTDKIDIIVTPGHTLSFAESAENRHEPAEGRNPGESKT